MYIRRKTTLAFVNHKCVDITDTSSAIEAQAREKFVERWGGMATVISLDGTSDGAKGKHCYCMLFFLMGCVSILFVRSCLT